MAHPKSVVALHQYTIFPLSHLTPILVVPHCHNIPIIHHIAMTPQHPDLLPVTTSYTINYSSFAPNTHVAYASGSSTGRHSIFLPPHYFSYSQLLMSTSSIHAKSSITFLLKYKNNIIHNQHYMIL